MVVTSGLWCLCPQPTLTLDKASLTGEKSQRSTRPPKKKQKLQPEGPELTSDSDDYGDFAAKGTSFVGTVGDETSSAVQSIQQVCLSTPIAEWANTHSLGFIGLGLTAASQEGKKDKYILREAFEEATLSVQNFFLIFPFQMLYQKNQ